MFATAIHQCDVCLESKPVANSYYDKGYVCSTCKKVIKTTFLQLKYPDGMLPAWSNQFGYFSGVKNE